MTSMTVIPALTALLLAATMRAQDTTRIAEPARSRTDSTLQFPKVEGSNLEGRKFSLPADFEGELNIVLVAFKREQQANVDTWVPFLKATAARHPNVRAYELPTLNRSYRFVRRFIDGGMSRGIPEKATRETTITLYIDKTPFKKTLGIGNEDQIVTLLVSRDGRVLWRLDGRHTPEAESALSAQLNDRFK